MGANASNLAEDSSNTLSGQDTPNISPRPNQEASGNGDRAENGQNTEIHPGFTETVGNALDLQIDSPVSPLPEACVNTEHSVENAEAVVEISNNSSPTTHPDRPSLRSVRSKASPSSLCCLIRCRTREHEDYPESKRSIWFEGKLGGVLKIGSDKDSGLVLRDDRCEKTHALIKCKQREVNGTFVSDLILFPCSRMYRQITSFQRNKISMGSVIKLGSISLEVINVNTSDALDFESTSFLDPYLLTIQEKQEDGEAKFEVCVKKPSLLQDDSKEVESTEIEEGEGDEKEVSTPKLKPEIVTEECHDLENVMCYICWGGVDLAQHKIINESENEIIDFSSPASNICEEVEMTKSTEKQAIQIAETVLRSEEESDFNPMIRNPCGNCSGCSQFIHYKCLMKWIKTSKSGHCSICNGVLPTEFSSKPPNLELKIIRHRRGQRWVGTRRFRLSFAETNTKTLGSAYRSDVILHDLSVSDIHAVIKFDRETREFFISDHNSKGGTYLQLTEPFVLNDSSETASLRQTRPSHFSLNPPGVGVNEFKIGRTSLHVKVVESKDKKNTLFKMLHRHGWRSNSNSTTTEVQERQRTE